MYDVTLELNAKLMPMDRGEIFEDPLSEQLEELGLGTVTGGGTMLEENGEVASCDIEIELNQYNDVALMKLLELINESKVAKGSILHCGDKDIPVGTEDGLAIYLNGTDLADEVYETCDINLVISSLNDAMGEVGSYYSYYQGNTETALYFYGTSFECMKELILPFVNTYPLCAQARIVCICNDNSIIRNEPISKKPNTTKLGQIPPVLKGITEFLDCPYQYFDPMDDDDPIMEAFQERIEAGKQNGFVPMIICEDEVLWECLLMNADPSSEYIRGSQHAVCSKEAVAAYRQRWLEEEVKDGETQLQEWISIRKEEAEDDDIDWDEELVGEISLQEIQKQSQYVSYWNYQTKQTIPLLIVELPVQYPWEVFAWLPFGGWNDCPNTQDLMAVAKYWYQKHGAIPAVMTHDTLEYRLDQPVKEEAALSLAVEHYAYCPDVVNDEVLGSLAGNLTVSNYWYFWWD